MSNIEIPNSGQARINNQIYSANGKASIELLYGPWPYDTDLTDFTWIDEDFTFPGEEDPKAKFVGLTVAKYTDNSNSKVTEYQLLKQGENYVFIEKSAGITADKVYRPLIVEEDGMLCLSLSGLFKEYQDNLTIKTISEGNGIGLINASQLTGSSLTAPVYYSQSTTGSGDHAVSQNHLYIKKDDISTWFNPQYLSGNGITVNNTNNTISIATSSSDSNKFLQSTGSGVKWTSLTLGTTYSEGNGISISNDTHQISVKVRTNGTAYSRGLYADANGLDLAWYGLSSTTSGFMFWDANQKRFTTENPEQLTTPSNTYQGTNGVTVNNESKYISLVNDVASVVQESPICYGKYIEDDNVAYGWYLLDGFYHEPRTSIYSLRQASDKSIGGVKASERTVNRDMRLEEIDGQWRYVEHIVADDTPDHSKPISQLDNFIAAECVLVSDNSGLNIFEDGKLYADLSEFVNISKTSNYTTLLPIICVDNGNGHKFYADASDIDVSTPIPNTVKAVYLFAENDSKETTIPQWIIDESRQDRIDYQIIRQQFDEILDDKVDILIQYEMLTLENITNLYIDPMVQKPSLLSKEYLVYIDLSNADEPCRIVTYSNTNMSGFEELTKLNSKYYLPINNKYVLSISCASTSAKCLCSVSKVKSFSTI